MCVLDFYVHEKCQRQGFGRQIFDACLEMEGLMPEHFAYDRPSPKLLRFLATQYGLHDYAPQNNNFVVYNDYFRLKGSSGKLKPSKCASHFKRHTVEDSRPSVASAAWTNSSHFVSPPWARGDPPLSLSPMPQAASSSEAEPVARKPVSRPAVSPTPWASHDLEDHSVNSRNARSPQPSNHFPPQCVRLPGMTPSVTFTEISAAGCSSRTLARHPQNACSGASKRHFN